MPGTARGEALTAASSTGALCLMSCSGSAPVLCQRSDRLGDSVSKCCFSSSDMPPTISSAMEAAMASSAPAPDIASGGEAPPGAKLSS